MYALLYAQPACARFNKFSYDFRQIWRPIPWNALSTVIGRTEIAWFSFTYDFNVSLRICVAVKNSRSISHCHQGVCVCERERALMFYPLFPSVYVCALCMQRNAILLCKSMELMMEAHSYVWVNEKHVFNPNTDIQERIECVSVSRCHAFAHVLLLLVAFRHQLLRYCARDVLLNRTLTHKHGKERLISYEGAFITEWTELDFSFLFFRLRPFKRFFFSFFDYEIGNGRFFFALVRGKREREKENLKMGNFFRLTKYMVWCSPFLPFSISLNFHYNVYWFVSEFYVIKYSLVVNLICEQQNRFRYFCLGRNIRSYICMYISHIPFMEYNSLWKKPFNISIKNATWIIAHRSHITWKKGEKKTNFNAFFLL